MSSADDLTAMFARDTQTKKKLMGADVLDRCGGVSRNEQLIGYVNEAQWTNDDKEQVAESGDSSWIADYAHLLARYGKSLLEVPFSTRLGGS